MRDIQDRRIEKEIDLLDQLPVQHKYKKVKEDYHIEITITNPDINEQTISFVIQVGDNFPFVQPKIFCKTSVNLILFYLIYSFAFQTFVMAGTY
jgi:ubiquitin-protein ligase